MKIKLTILIAFLYLGSAFAAGHITKAQKEKTIECLGHYSATAVLPADTLSLIHISEPTRPLYISYAVFCLKKKK